MYQQIYTQLEGDKAVTSTTVTNSTVVPWWSTLIQGIFSLIVGLLLLTNPVATTVVIVQFVGIYWLITGIFSLVGIFVDRSLWGLKLISSILGIMAGFVVLQHPLWSSLLLPSILVITLGVNGLIIGIIGLIALFKGGGWGTGIIGILSLLFGALLLGSPFLASLALPWVYGILGVVGGVAAIIVSLQQRKVVETV